MEDLPIVAQAEIPPDDNKYWLSIEEVATIPKKYSYGLDDTTKRRYMANK